MNLVCTICLEEKDFEEFALRGKRGKPPVCRKCYPEYRISKKISRTSGNNKRPLEDIKEMYRLRLSGNTLKEIGKIFGITKARVGQLLVSYGLKTSGFVLQYRSSVARGNIDKTNSEISKILGVSPTTVGHYRSDLRYLVDGNNNNAVKIGDDGENRVSEKLTELNIKNSFMPRGSSFDILLENGIRIDVKTAIAKSQTSPSQKCTQYKFHLVANKKEACDFFVCLIPSGDMFVVPFSAVKGKDSIYITWPKPSRSWSKLHQYHNRFDLLSSTDGL